MLLEINPINPQPRKINQVVELLKKGGVIAYPTDTQYGIGCDIMNKKAIERVYQIKQWPKHKPFSFICSDLKNISHYAKVSNYAYKTMRRLLPGPYTFILEGSKQVPKMMLTKRKTAGIRVPDNPICIALISALGHPVISATASIRDGEIFNEPWLIEEQFGKQLDMVIDGGPVPGGTVQRRFPDR
jgi:tRNA threonylcarbamoyl adenosine modification protein (Sua5/YciO/YrdC/YwlC family)